MMGQPAVAFARVREADAERGDRAAPQHRGGVQRVPAPERAHAPGGVRAEVARARPPRRSRRRPGAPARPAGPSRRVTASRSPPKACPQVIHPSRRPAPRRSPTSRENGAGQRRAVRHDVRDPRARPRPGRAAATGPIIECSGAHTTGVPGQAPRALDPRRDGSPRRCARRSAPGCTATFITRPVTSWPGPRRPRRRVLARPRPRSRSARRRCPGRARPRWC